MDVLLFPDLVMRFLVLPLPNRTFPFLIVLALSIFQLFFPTADSVSCWPPSPVDTLAVISCFEDLNGVKYDPTGTEGPKEGCGLAHRWRAERERGISVARPASCK